MGGRCIEESTVCRDQLRVEIRREQNEVGVVARYLPFDGGIEGTEPSIRTTNELQLHIADGVEGRPRIGHADDALSYALAKSVRHFPNKMLRGNQQQPAGFPLVEKPHSVVAAGLVHHPLQGHRRVDNSDVVL